MTVSVREMLYSVWKVHRLICSSSAELVSDKYAVHAIPTVETKGFHSISDGQVASQVGELTIWN